MKTFPHFSNLPLRDFSLPQARSEYEVALRAISEKIAAQEFVAYPIIDGKAAYSTDLIDRTDPSNSSILVGRTHASEVLRTRSSLMRAVAARRRPKLFEKDDCTPTSRSMTAYPASMPAKPTSRAMSHPMSTASTGARTK